MTIPGISNGEMAEKLNGIWGGDRAQLVLDAQGGRLTMDCANGQIDGPIQMNKLGVFTASGTFEQHQPGPQAADALASTSARFSGAVTADSLQLTITPTGTGQSQVFSLRKGVRVKIIRCL